MFAFAFDYSILLSIRTQSLMKDSIRWHELLKLITQILKHVWIYQMLF